MSFKRSPSKVWWGSESLEFREVSASPGSQDSGFSDTETSPRNSERNRAKNSSKHNLKEVIEEGKEENNNDLTPKSSGNQEITKNIFKDRDNTNSKTNLNLSSNYQEKLTPVKRCIDERLTKSEGKSSPHFLKKFSVVNGGATDPMRKQRYGKYSPKVSRNLFASSKNTQECPDNYSNQYSKLTQSSKPRSREETNEDEKEDSRASDRSLACDTSSEISGTKSLPIIRNGPGSIRRSRKSNKTAPACLDSSLSTEESEAVTSFNTSECDSELEELFGRLEGPGHTSTPKGDIRGSLDSMRRRGQKARLQQRLKLRYQDNERVPPVHTDGVTVDNEAVLRWLQEARYSIEQECTTMLQCKSIAAELGEKVSHLAACATTILRGLLSEARCIEQDYRNLKTDTQPLISSIQNLARNILDFYKSHTGLVNSKTLQIYEKINKSSLEEALANLELFYVEWESTRTQILIKEIKKLVEKLEDPTSDTDLRASLTGVTSVSLRNTDLIEHFVKADIIPILLILCEKCDGSSMRTLILRALSTMCCNSTAVRLFEKFSGVQIIADTLEEDSRPEPERSEAVALLAQVTAPWLEDNHSVQGLQDYSKKLVQSLTKFAADTKCCQNLLLCAAALANLSSMDAKCIKFLVQFRTAPVLLSAVKNRGPMVSVYLLEQVATLLANMAAVEDVRRQLIDADAVIALLHFLKQPRINQNEDVERRLQQKGVIALSRLCGDKKGSNQVVENDGLRLLVQLCREKQERFNSDAVLVAALATLRKIAEACGTEMLNEQDCQELVEPKLLDSFLAYSAQNESYV
ncbi:protein inscuteable homolog isoform X2 [Sitophilus oryzae]|nr:protein inscuteable homolog isoform X2 [Sitophilus oryzae]XP_030747718.1 protein inscuteable homolog isoform X2 [Sitophilus oryzae]XP_030747719.1 protein inscuteable homolog isoform X2 [Sitophilus oryzae]XP_030747720.1 protein inscuteable homolog isoform X2 [Sitophilus oryzae]